MAKWRTYEEELAVRHLLKEKEDEWVREETEIRSTETERLVPEKFHQYLKVFEKVDSERMPMRKV